MWWFERETVLIGSGVWIPGPLLRELSAEAVDPLGVAFMEDVPCWGQVWRDTSLTHFQSLSLRPMCGEKCGPSASCLLPYFPAMMAFYTPAGINGFPPGCSQQFSLCVTQHHSGFSIWKCFLWGVHRAKTMGGDCSALASSALHLTDSDLCFPVFSHRSHFLLPSHWR